MGRELYIDVYEQRYGDIKVKRVVKPVELRDEVYWWTNSCGEWSAEHFEIIDGEHYILRETEKKTEGRAADGSTWESPIYELSVAPDGWVLMKLTEIEQCNERSKYVLYVGTDVEVKRDEEYQRYQKTIDKLIYELDSYLEKGEKLELAEKVRARIRELFLDYAIRKGLKVGYIHGDVVEYTDDFGRPIYTDSLYVDVDEEFAPLCTLLKIYLRARKNNEKENQKKAIALIKKLYDTDRIVEGITALSEQMDLTKDVIDEIMAQVNRGEVG